ncbi:hypothetical protein [Kitasatospora sp. LaBMicrA B282]|uniref:hypothetical protein n=1 Tax=Kitasatospora sp. LaBMicrA B282 TaxID=3420949 RepID=UPI003D0A9E1E
MTNQVELRRQYALRFDEIPDGPEQVELLEWVFERLLDSYLHLDGTNESGLLEEAERTPAAAGVPDRALCLVLIAAARKRIPEVPAEVTYSELVRGQSALCYLMLPRLKWRKRQLVGLICEVEQRIEERGVVLHPAVAWAPEKRPSMTERKEYQEAVAAVWAARTESEASPALARCNSYFAVASLLFFRTAIRWKFSEPCDPREVARVISNYLAAVGEEGRHLFAPRDAEVAIRAELNGENGLVDGIPVDQEPARMAMQMVTKNVFGEAIVTPEHSSQLRRIAESVEADHQEIARLTAMRLDRLFASRSFDPAEVEVEVARITGRGTRR